MVDRQERSRAKKCCTPAWATMLMGNPPPHWPRVQFQPRLEPALCTCGRPVAACGKAGRLPQMPQASPMSSTCRDVMLPQACGKGPVRELPPTAREAS